MADKSDFSVPAKDIFDHTNPFHDDALHNPGETNGAALEPVHTEPDHDSEDHHNLVGVVSDNPFANNERSASNTEGHNVDAGAVAPGDPSFHNPAAEETRPTAEPESRNTLSPIDALSDGVDPRDTSLGGGSPGGDLDPAADRKAPVQTTNSNINNDRCEAGTEPYMIPQSPIQDGGEAAIDSPQKQAEEDHPRIAFADADQIDSTLKSGSKDQSDLPHGRRQSVRRGTIQGDDYDFSGKLGLTRGE